MKLIKIEEDGKLYVINPLAIEVVYDQSTILGNKCYVFSVGGDESHYVFSLSQQEFIEIWEEALNS